MSDNLPTNRIQLFGYNFKRWDTMLSLSLLVGLFALPLFAVVMASAIIDADITRQLQAATEQADKYAYTIRLLRADSVCALISVVAFYPFCLGISGALYYCKKTAWAEGATLNYDFWHGVKLSFKDAIVPSLFAALTYLFYVSVKWFVTYYVTDTAFKVVALALAAVVICTISAAVMFDLTQSKVYDGAVGHRVKNSIVFALARFFRNILTMACTFAPMALMLWLAPQVWAQLIAFGLYTLYGFGSIAFGQTLYAHSVFDDLVNKEHYPEVVRKGLSGNDK